MTRITLNRRRVLYTAVALSTVLVLLVLRSRVSSPASSSVQGSDSITSLNDQLETGLWRGSNREAGGYADRKDVEAVETVKILSPPPPAMESPNVVAKSVCSKYVELGVIFTKAAKNPSMLENLQRLLDTMGSKTSTCVNVNMFVDQNSSVPAQEAFKAAGVGDNFMITLHDISPMAESMKSLIGVMQQYFAPRPGSYYNDVLFFLTTTMHRSLSSMRRIIMIDVDVSVRADIAVLDRLFQQFSPEQVMGISHDLSPVYRHVLREYRLKNPSTSAGSPATSSTGFPGFNSGVVLLDLDKMRASNKYNSLLNDQDITRRVNKYQFKGHLGDQDFYTLVALDDPQLFYVLPCGWNRQLCQFWNNDLYKSVFDEYFHCSDNPVNIYHGNCKTPLPPETQA